MVACSSEGSCQRTQKPPIGSPLSAAAALAVPGTAAAAAGNSPLAWGKGRYGTLGNGSSSDRTRARSGLRPFIALPEEEEMLSSAGAPVGPLAALPSTFNPSERLLELLGGVLDGAPGLVDPGGHAEEAVDHARVPGQLDLEPGLAQVLGVQLALVAQDVV